MTFLLTLVLLLFAVRLIRTLSDRGAREHVGWFFSQEEYIEYISALDREGWLIRDWVGRVRRAHTRARYFFISFVFPLAILLAPISIAHAVGRGIVFSAAASAIIVASSPVRSVLALRRLGIVERQIDRIGWLVVAVSCAFLGVATFIAACALHDFAFRTSSLSTASYVLASSAAALLILSSVVVDLVFRVVYARDIDVRFGDDATAESLLFLRSFEDDAAKVHFPAARNVVRQILGPRLNFEEVISQMLSDEGKLVAIGKPNEKLAGLGAARRYFSDDEWQRAVQVTAARAGAIFLVAGSSKGLKWEVEHLKNWSLLPKTMFIFPPSSGKEAYVRMVNLFESLDVSPEFKSSVADKFRATTLLGLRTNGLGDFFLHTGDGRDYANYLGAINCFLRELDGSMIPPPPGGLSKLNGYG